MKGCCFSCIEKICGRRDNDVFAGVDVYTKSCRVNDLIDNQESTVTESINSLITLNQDAISELTLPFKVTRFPCFDDIDTSPPFKMANISEQTCQIRSLF